MTEKAFGAVGGWGSQNFYSALCTGRLYPQEISLVHIEAEKLPGPQCGRKGLSRSIPRRASTNCETVYPVHTARDAINDVTMAS